MYIYIIYTSIRLNSEADHSNHFISPNYWYSSHFIGRLLPSSTAGGDSGIAMATRRTGRERRCRNDIHKTSVDQCRPVCVCVHRLGQIYIYIYRSGQASIPQPKRHRTAKRPVQMFRLGWHRNCPSPVSGRLPPGMLHGSCCPLLSESTGPWCSAHVTGLWLWKQLKHNVNIIHIIDWRYSSTEF